MNKFILLLCFILSTIIVNSQYSDTVNTTNKTNNFSPLLMPYTTINAADYFESGVMVGLNTKDIVLLGGFWQKSVLNNDFAGIYTQVNFNPKSHDFHVGVLLKTGWVNCKYLSLEPSIIIQHNIKDDRFRLSHSISIIGGWPSYTFGFMFGNFKEKVWKNP